MKHKHRTEVRGQRAENCVQKTERENGTASGKSALWRRRKVILIGTLVLGAVLFFGFRYLVESFTHESTDDAFLDANVISIAPRVAGQVQKDYVKNNQRVEAGAWLLDIDPRDLQVQLEQKQAAFKAAQANVDLLLASIELLKTQITTAEATAKQSTAEAIASQATAERAAADLKRAEELSRNRTISPQEFDTARAVAAAAEASLKAAQEKAASDQSKIAQAHAQFEAGRKAYDRAQAQTQQAEADVRAAELNLSYVRVTAPEAGYVTRKAVEPGDYVQVGQRLMALVPLQLYVTANFKETQLINIRTNQPAKVTIDSIGGRRIAGHVESIMAGSGARFSLLPPENAVGNYVKVVQRVPVKIVFDEPLPAEHVLGPGMSVVPLVRVRSTEPSETLFLILAILVAALVGVSWWILTGSTQGT